MEVFIRFINDNIWLVVLMAIAVVGIIGISATLIALKVREKLAKKKKKEIEE